MDSFLQAQNTGVLATVTPDGEPRVCTVFYVALDPRRLVFKSRVASEHIANIAQRPLAAVAIYDHDSTYKSKRGVQLLGEVSQLRDIAEMKTAMRAYSKQFQGAREKFDSEEKLISDSAQSTLYVFKIRSWKYTDTKLRNEPSKYDS